VHIKNKNFHSALPMTHDE